MFSNFRKRARFVVAFAATVLISSTLADRADAQGASFLDGTVTSAARPISGAVVTVTGNNATLVTRTDAVGHFRFTTLQPGSYTVVASAPEGRREMHLDLGGSGATVTVDLSLKTIGSVTATLPASPPVHGSGTDLTLTGPLLSHSPASMSFPSLLLQLPGAARGANGVVHINGDHGDINYIVDGVPIPQELNREVGSEFDVSDAAFVDVIEGAYPAQYGGRFASVIDISTRAGNGTAGYDASIGAGTYGHQESSFTYHRPLGRGNLVLASSAASDDRALDPPDFGAAIHDRGSNVNHFLRITLPTSAADYVNLTVSDSYQTFQIPNDVARGQPAATDDVETQLDTFAAVQFRHAIGNKGMLSFGPSFKHSRIRDFGDAQNDFIFGEALNIASGGAATDCADALTSGSFGPTTCAYSLNATRSAADVGWIADYALQSARHAIRAGVSYDATNVQKNYAITLQPGNFLSVEPVTVVDNAPNVGHTESLYLQDKWKIGQNYEVDYGLRADAFQLSSTEFRDGASQVSPRVKITRLFGPRAGAYAYYGRFFTPFSFENVSPAAAQLLNLPLQRTVAAFDLKPQRDSNYEIGGHLPLGAGELGLRVMQKNAADLIDDTQVGTTALHQDINYLIGRIATQSLYYQRPLPRGGRIYASVNHTYSVNKGCETQLLAPCFGAPDDWTPADHEQRWGANAGIVWNTAHGWFSADGEYGSGLSSNACAPSVAFCKYTPHTVFDVERGFDVGNSAGVVVRISNILNDRYFITYQNAQGNHVAAGRAIDVTLRLSR